MAKDKVQEKSHIKYKLNRRPRIYDDAFILIETDAFYEWMNDNSHAIYFKEFAFERGYDPSKLMVFAERSEEFRQALAIAHEWQEMRLAKGGLDRTYAEGFTKFVLARNHGWSDTKNINITSNGPVPGWIAEASGESPGLVNAKKPSSGPTLED
jgi:hypothetical protein